MKKNKSVTLSCTKRFTDKSGEYYLKNVLLQKLNPEGIFKKLSLKEPTNIKDCIHKCQGIKPLKEKANQILTKLPEFALTPIPRMSKNHIRSHFDNQELALAERTAVHIRRLEYSMEINRIRRREYFDMKKIKKIVFLQQWWKTLYKVIKIQKTFKGYYFRKNLMNLLEEQEILINRFFFLDEVYRKILYRKFINRLRNSHKNLKLFRFIKGKEYNLLKKKFLVWKDNNIIKNLIQSIKKKIYKEFFSKLLQKAKIKERIKTAVKTKVLRKKKANNSKRTIFDYWRNRTQSNKIIKLILSQRKKCFIPVKRKERKKKDFSNTSTISEKNENENSEDKKCQNKKLKNFFLKAYLIEITKKWENAKKKIKLLLLKKSLSELERGITIWGKRLKYFEIYKRGIENLSNYFKRKISNFQRDLINYLKENKILEKYWNLWKEYITSKKVIIALIKSKENAVNKDLFSKSKEFIEKAKKNIMKKLLAKKRLYTVNEATKIWKNKMINIYKNKIKNLGMKSLMNTIKRILDKRRKESFTIIKNIRENRKSSFKIFGNNEILIKSDKRKTEYSIVKNEQFLVEQLNEESNLLLKKDPANKRIGKEIEKELNIVNTTGNPCKETLNIVYAFPDFHRENTEKNEENKTNNETNIFSESNCSNKIDLSHKNNFSDNINVLTKAIRNWKNALDKNKIIFALISQRKLLISNKEYGKEKRFSRSINLLEKQSQKLDKFKVGSILELNLKRLKKITMKLSLRKYFSLWKNYQSFYYLEKIYNYSSKEMYGTQKLDKSNIFPKESENVNQQFLALKNCLKIIDSNNKKEKLKENLIQEKDIETENMHETPISSSQIDDSKESLNNLFISGSEERNDFNGDIKENIAEEFQIKTSNKENNMPSNKGLSKIYKKKKPQSNPVFKKKLPSDVMNIPLIISPISSPSSNNPIILPSSKLFTDIPLYNPFYLPDSGVIEEENSEDFNDNDFSETTLFPKNHLSSSKHQKNNFSKFSNPTSLSFSKSSFSQLINQIDNVHRILQRSSFQKWASLIFKKKILNIMIKQQKNKQLLLWAMKIWKSSFNQFPLSKRKILSLLLKKISLTKILKNNKSTLTQPLSVFKKWKLLLKPSETVNNFHQKEKIFQEVSQINDNLENKCKNIVRVFNKIFLSKKLEKLLENLKRIQVNTIKIPKINIPTTDSTSREMKRTYHYQKNRNMYNSSKQTPSQSQLKKTYFSADYDNFPSKNQTLQINEDESEDTSNCSGYGGSYLVQKNKEVIIPIDFTSQSFFFEPSLKKDKDLSLSNPMAIRGDFYDKFRSQNKMLYRRNKRIQVTTACPLNEVVKKDEIDSTLTEKEKEEKLKEKIVSLCDKEINQTLKERIKRNFSYSSAKKSQKNNKGYSVAFPIERNYVSWDFGKDIIGKKDIEDNLKKVILFQENSNFSSSETIIDKKARNIRNTSKSLLTKTFSFTDSSKICESFKLREINSSQFYRNSVKKSIIEQCEQNKSHPIKNPFLYSSAKRKNKLGKTPSFHCTKISNNLIDNLKSTFRSKVNSYKS